MNHTVINHALLLVDLQNDFCPNGALPVAQGDVTIDIANVAIAAAQKAGILVIASQDWHPANHLSFADNNPGAVVGERGELAGLAQTWWPVHCVQGTRGAEFHPRLNREAFDAVIQKGTQHDMDSYSAFFDNGKRAATALDNLLRQRGITRLTIMGLATDYCVKFTVLDALKLGYDVQIVEEGCRGVNLQPDDSEAALADMVAHGARRIGLADVIAISTPPRITPSPCAFRDLGYWRSS